MSYKTLSQDILHPHVAKATEVQTIHTGNKSTASIMWLMMALVFIPMFAIHIGIRLTSPDTGRQSTEIIEVAQTLP